MRRFASALCIASLTLAGWASAQAPARLPATLEGTWRSSVSPERARGIAMAAFRPRLSNLPSFIRGMVERRIAERMPSTRRIDLEIEGDRVSVEDHGEGVRRVETPLGGSTRVRGRDGEVRRVTQRLRGGWLEQIVEGEDSTVRRLFSTEPDGRTLHVDMTVEQERLGDPVRWRVDFTR